MADEVDRANDLFEDLRTVEIRSISRALERKNNDIICIDCDEEIEPQRRKALPSAIRCIGCAEKEEKRTRVKRF